MMSLRLSSRLPPQSRLTKPGSTDPRGANPDVPFVVWTGHPMHFTVRVGAGPDQVEVVPGE